MWSFDFLLHSCFCCFFFCGLFLTHIKKYSANYLYRLVFIVDLMLTDTFFFLSYTYDKNLDNEFCITRANAFILFLCCYFYNFIKKKKIQQICKANVYSCDKITTDMSQLANVTKEKKKCIRIKNSSVWSSTYCLCILFWRLRDWKKWHVKCRKSESLKSLVV